MLKNQSNFKIKFCAYKLQQYYAARPKYELYIHDQFLYHRQIHISGRKVKLYRQVMDSLQKVKRPNQQTLLL